MVGNPSFKAVWDSDNFVKAGEIAFALIEGDELSIRKARGRKEVNELVKYYTKLGNS